MPISKEKHSRCLNATTTASKELSKLRQNPSLTSQTKSASIAVHTLQSFERMVFSLSYGQLSEASAIRDEAMASTLLLIRDTINPGKRTAIWAHGYHLAKGYDAIPDLPDGSKASKVMGMYLEDQIGSRYWNMDTWGFEVHVNWPGQSDPEIPTSNEVTTKLLHDRALKNALVDSHRSFLATQELKMTSDTDPKLSIPKIFDAVMFLDYSDKMQPESP
ncbi:MAG: erythromycin esterase family protein [Proteobacteria bacterium]|nr:erythromycin esterase family protein [Pseudomonadota bacterium]